MKVDLGEGLAFMHNCFIKLIRMRLVISNVFIINDPF